LLRIVTTPIAFVDLELAAIYGIFTPYNSRKLYARIEKINMNIIFWLHFFSQILNVMPLAEILKKEM